MLACKEAWPFAASVAVSGSLICNTRATLEDKVVCLHTKTFSAAHAAVPSLSSQHQGQMIPAVVQANEE